jgi:predicted RNA-binding Zn ribbon-like protein
MKGSQKSSKFLWLGNSPAVDFVNTQIAQDGAVIDLLGSGKDVLLWLSEAGLLPVQTVLPSSPEFLEQAVRFARQYRVQLRNGMEQIARQGSLRDSLIAATNKLLLSDTHAVRIQRQGERFKLEERWRLSEPEMLCAPIAYSFALLLSNGELGRLRRCKNPDCILFFYDTSKSGTRSWCSLDICGNRLRVEAFRERQKKGQKVRR